MINSVVATVLFVRDLDGCTTFYRDTLGLQMENSDAFSASFKIGNLYFLLLKVANAAQLIGEEGFELRTVGRPHGLLAAGVENVDTVYETLKAKGVTLLRPPTDQPWGLRTAHFADPEGNLWEINQPVEAKG